MHPILFKIGSFPIHTYGVLIALGFIAASYTIKKLAIKSNVNVDLALDLTFWSLVYGLLGARILFVITRIHTFIADPISVFKIWEGGLVFFGGFIAAMIFLIYFIRKHKLNIWKILDVLTPGLVIAHSIGRLGCIAAGCCYGKPSGTDFGIQLNSELVDIQFRGINLHPTQIYEASALFLLFLGLIWVFKHKKTDGQVALTYLILYPIIRSVVEIFRGDIIRGFIIEDLLSTSQFISILVFLVGVVFLIKRTKAASK